MAVNKKNSSKTKAKSKNNSKKKKSSITWISVLAALLVFAGYAAYLYFARPADFSILKEKTVAFVSNTIDSVFNTEEESETEAVASAEKNANKSTEKKPAQTKNVAANAKASAPDVKGNYPENSHLYFGNPSGAVADVSYVDNYLMEKKQYALSYNSLTCNPNWVMWHLGLSDIGDADRSNDFRPDEELPSEFYAVVKADYQYTKYGFDRGHVCPSADRTSSQTDNSATFYMTNMIPQAPDCNRVVWKDFEAYERSLVVEKGKELYVVAGPYGKGGQSAMGKFDSIVLVGKGTGHEITVPEYCWKIVVVMDEGENDLSRVTADTTVISLWMPNSQGIGKNGGWEQYLTCVDFIEEKTGYDFLAFIPNEIEDVLEAKIYSIEKGL